MMTQVPSQTERGSFNAINASIQQLSGGLASLVAGHIVHVNAKGHIENYDIAGYVVICTSVLTAWLLWKVQRGLANPIAVSSPQS
jgi:sugar phosphate permease